MIDLKETVYWRRIDSKLKKWTRTYDMPPNEPLNSIFPLTTAQENPREVGFVITMLTSHGPMEN